MKNEKSAEKVATESDFNIATRKKTNQANIKLDKLQDFEDHPYKVQDDEAMEELKASIKEFGLLNRILVRPLDDGDGKYEIIAGHRRVHAAKALGLKELPAIIYPIDHDEATLLMVDSNNQRTDISPMEKGRAYRMKLDAIKRQGERSDLTSRHSVEKLEISAELVSDTDSGRTVQRYIRLTYLIPELQEYVENGQMKMLPAVEISYLDEEAQRDIVDRITETEAFPSHAQARKMKALFEEGKLDYHTVAEIMAEIKPNQVEKLKIQMDDIRKFAPQCSTPQEFTDYILKLMKKEYDRQRSRDDVRE